MIIAKNSPCVSSWLPNNQGYTMQIPIVFIVHNIFTTPETPLCVRVCNCKKTPTTAKITTITMRLIQADRKMYSFIPPHHTNTIAIKIPRYFTARPNLSSTIKFNYYFNMQGALRSRQSREHWSRPRNNNADLDRLPPSFWQNKTSKFPSFQLQIYLQCGRRPF